MAQNNSVKIKSSKHLSKTLTGIFKHVVPTTGLGLPSPKEIEKDALYSFSKEDLTCNEEEGFYFGANMIPKENIPKNSEDALSRSVIELNLKQCDSIKKLLVRYFENNSINHHQSMTDIKMSVPLEENTLYARWRLERVRRVKAMDEIRQLREKLAFANDELTKAKREHEYPEEVMSSKERKKWNRCETCSEHLKDTKQIDSDKKTM